MKSFDLNQIFIAKVVIHHWVSQGCMSRKGGIISVKEGGYNQCQGRGHNQCQGRGA